MINTKKAFTLVELIVVITILAILGTIAFISLQGYSADARNSKRTEDLNNLAGSVNIKTTKGSPLLSFVADNTAEPATLPQIGGETATSNVDYKAGTPNHTALGVKAEDFKDPTDADYRVGATTKKNGQFEFAASMENGAGDDTAKVTGNYNGRGDNAITVSALTTTSVTVLDADINKFFRGDFLKDNTTGTGEVIKVSSDGKTLTLAAGATLAGTGVQLATTEAAGLIKNVDDTALVSDGTTNVPY